MKNFNIYYRIRGNKDANVFCTTISAWNRKDALESAKQDFCQYPESYVIVICHLAD